MAETSDPGTGEQLTGEEAAKIRALFAAGKACKHCGGIHTRACPRVRRLVFQGDNLIEVEFWPEGRWSDEHIIWPEDVPEPDEPAAQ